MNHLRTALAVSCIALAAVAPAADAEPGDAERVARDYMAAYSAADFERMGAMMAEDIAFADPTNPADDGGLETQGREATMAMLHAFDEQYRPIGLNFAWDTVFESHDRVVFMGHVNATYPTDRPGQVFRWRAAQVTVITVRDGRVTRHQDFADYEHAEQGLVPAE